VTMTQKKQKTLKTMQATNSAVAKARKRRRKSDSLRISSHCLIDYVTVLLIIVLMDAIRNRIGYSPRSSQRRDAESLASMLGKERYRRKAENQSSTVNWNWTPMLTQLCVDPIAQSSTSLVVNVMYRRIQIRTRRSEVCRLSKQLLLLTTPRLVRQRY
jgi:hypothetical protein